MIEDAYDTIVSLDDFEKLVIEQGWFENESKWEPILKMCDDLQTRDEIGAQFSAINDDEYGVYFSTELYKIWTNFVHSYFKKWLNFKNFS